MLHYLIWKSIKLYVYSHILIIIFKLDQMKKNNMWNLYEYNDEKNVFKRFSL